MTLSIHLAVLGPLQNNVYFLVDNDSGDCALIDPSFEPQTQLRLASEQGWQLRQIWLTHGHYDHTTGAKLVSEAFSPPLPIAMHPDGFAWAEEHPEGVKMGMRVDPVPTLDIPLVHGMWLDVDPTGTRKLVEVRDVSGHNPGSVLFYIPELEMAIVGDAIFRGSIGRTDFEGSDHKLLLKNIREQIYTLPDETTLLPGHGPATTVGFEMENNPFVRG
jgi:glyoxylase-like metal-dependent hydrolase (beta-lactamase superfamily II)